MKKRQWWIYVAAFLMPVFMGLSPLFIDALSSHTSGGTFKARYLFGLSRMADCVGAEEQSYELYMKAWDIDEVPLRVDFENEAHAEMAMKLMDAAKESGEAGMSIGYVDGSISGRYGVSSDKDVRQFYIQKSDLKVYKACIRKAGGKNLREEDFK